MTCKHSFRTNNPHKILRAVYVEQRNANPNPTAAGDFVSLRSRDLFNAAGLGISDTAKYSILTKLCLSGLLSVHGDPNHKQALRYSLTLQGLQCLRCYRYQEAIEPAPEDFRCGSVTTDV